MRKQEIKREVQQRLPPPCFMCFDWRHSLLYLLLNLLLAHYSLWLFSACCIEDLVKIYEIMNTDNYPQILIHHTMPSGKHVIDNSFNFQQ